MQTIILLPTEITDFENVSTTIELSSSTKSCVIIRALEDGEFEPTEHFYIELEIINSSIQFQQRIEVSVVNIVSINSVQSTIMHCHLYIHHLLREASQMLLSPLLFPIYPLLLKILKCHLIPSPQLTTLLKI